MNDEATTCNLLDLDFVDISDILNNNNNLNESEFNDLINLDEDFLKSFAEQFNIPEPVKSDKVIKKTKIVWHDCNPVTLSKYEYTNNFWSNLPPKLLIELIINAYLKSCLEEGKVFIDLVKTNLKLYPRLYTIYEKLIISRNSCLDRINKTIKYERDPILATALAGYFHRHISDTGRKIWTIKGNWRIQLDFNDSPDYILLIIRQSAHYDGFERFLTFYFKFPKNSLEFLDLLKFTRVVETGFEFTMTPIQMYNAILLPNKEENNMYPLLSYKLI